MCFPLPEPTLQAVLESRLISKSIAASGGYGMCATTALVAQNTQGVSQHFCSTTEFLQEQLAAVFDDVTVDAVKIGMLGDVETITTVQDLACRTSGTSGGTLIR